MISMCLVSYVVEILQLENNLLIFFGVETFTKGKFDGERSMVVFEIIFCKPIRPHNVQQQDRITSWQKVFNSGMKGRCQTKSQYY